MKPYVEKEILRPASSQRMHDQALDEEFIISIIISITIIIGWLYLCYVCFAAFILLHELLLLYLGIIKLYTRNLLILGYSYDNNNIIIIIIIIIIIDIVCCYQLYQQYLYYYTYSLHTAAPRLLRTRIISPTVLNKYLYLILIHT